MERRLYDAAAKGDVTSLLDLLKEDPLILDRCMVWSCDETPLHVAAMLGHEEFVEEILERKPELAGELDSRKLSPLHLVTAKGYLGVVKKLLNINANMCYTRDKYGRNPLHIAAVKGRIDVLEELVQESPNAARHKMEHGETILHLCVKHNNLEALKLLLETIGDHEFINLKNDDGNTILHLAAADKQTESLDASDHRSVQTINFLMSRTTVEVNSLNQNGQAIDDLLNQSWKKSVKKQYDWLERKKSALMVVASLTATMAFQVGVNPPGGFWQDTIQGTNPHNAGNSIMADNYPVGYSIFLATNTIGFLASLSIILLLVSGLPLKHRFFMWIMMVILWIAITSIAYTYCLSITTFTPTHDTESFYSTIQLGIYAWAGLMVMLLVGHTIQLRACLMIHNIKKLVTQRRSSASLVMHHDDV
ncbi:hypothetical protein BT93_E0135 [Corymbia citriodora subsp. variegata]|nr:hypothetical protein BT93_E0135 [Corymbia citriodora subsp. variegata]